MEKIVYIKGKHIRTGGNPFCITKSYIRNRLFPDIFSAEWAFVCGDPTSKEFKNIEISRKDAVNCIDRYSMSKICCNKEGEVYEMPGCPYKAAYEGCYAREEQRLREEFIKWRE